MSAREIRGNGKRVGLRLTPENVGELPVEGLEDLRLADRKSSLKPHQSTKTLAGTLIVPKLQNSRGTESRARDD